MKVILLLALVASSCLAQRAHLVSQITGGVTVAKVITAEQKADAQELLANADVRALNDKHLRRVYAKGAKPTLVYYSSQVVSGSAYVFVWKVGTGASAWFVAVDAWHQPWQTPAYQIKSCSAKTQAAALKGIQGGVCN